LSHRHKPTSCFGCSLHDHGNDFSAVEGTGSNGVLIVAEASGEMEQRDQLPLRPYAPSGAVLERCLRRMGLDRQAFAITNCVRCRPRKNFLEGAPWEYAALRHCRPNLDSAIEQYRPRCIVALGGVALRELTGEAGEARGVTHLAGYIMPLASSRVPCDNCISHDSLDVPRNQRMTDATCDQCHGTGYVSGAGTIPTIANFHPAYLRRGKASHQGVFSRIIQRALAVASGRDKSYMWGVDPGDQSTWTQPDGSRLQYWTHPSLDQCRSVLHYLRDNPRLWIAKDIETSESSSLDEDAREGFSDTEVRLFQLSYQPGTGIAIPYTGEFKAVVRELLHLENPAFGHNWNCFSHDTNVLMGNGKWKPIWKVKAGDMVMSVDVMGDVCKRFVTKLHETKDSRPWVEVRVDGSYNSGVGRWGNRGVVCTPEHEWYTSDLRKVKAEHLKVGDKVLLPRQGSYKLIEGTLLGDASTNRGRLKVSHTNEAWAKAKAENLGVVCKPYKNRGFGLEVISWTASVPVPKYWRRLFYAPNKTKRWVSPTSLESLAVFYGDDGCLDSHECATFCLHSFDWPDVQRAVSWFGSMFGECKLQNERVLRLWKESSNKFFTEVATYVHPSVAYKIPERFRGNYNGWMAYPVPQIGEVESVVPTKVKGHSSVGKRKFCLTVDSEHRFFTRGGLVSNCFDHKVLRACAAREEWRYAPPTRVFDTLDMFHHWQPDLPAHLQFCSSFINFPFPWKHLAATDIEFYGICDVDADLRLGLFLEATLKKDNLWGEGDAYSLTTGYTGQEREVRPVLAAMEDRGVPIDDAARLKLGAEFEAAQRELGIALMAKFPESAKKPDPYKTFPPELKKLPTSDWGRLFQEPDRWKCKCGRENKMDALTCGKCSRPQEDGRIKAGKWYTYGQREVEEVTAGPDLELVRTRVVRWCYIPEFNPNSGKQLIEYMKAMGHKVPKSKEEDADGNQKDTTAAKELMRLAIRTGDMIYNDVIEYRGLTKMRGTYVDGFRPASDGCVHTTFTYSTAIVQLGSRNPNCQNFPKLKPTPALAKAMRAMICAPEGKIITEMDWKSCHVITLGLLANDPVYTRLGRLDIHSAVAGHFLGHWNLKEIINETDEQLLARFKWLKSDPERKRVRDDQAKHAILGIGNGLRAKGLYERYMESFPSRECSKCGGTARVAGVRGLKRCPDCGGTGRQSGLSIADSILSMCENDLFGAVFAYQEEQRKEAHERQQLRNDFGHMRRFYEVYRWDSRKGAWSHGDQAEEAVAYRLASVAHSHMRELLKELYRNGMAERYGLFNTVHDSIMLCHDESLKDDVLRDVAPVMMAESKVMPGLWLGVEASQGRRWSDMREVTIPSTLTPQTTIAAATNTVMQEASA